MPLVLAVEQDPGQIAHVTSLTRGRPRTELVIAESVALAIDFISARVPDVLLVSPQLSHDDQRRIADCLAGLGRAAAHVKMLTTPSPPPVSRPCSTAKDQQHRQAVSPAPAESGRLPGTPTHPTQDEWGFFDPDQCGFPALVKADSHKGKTAAPEPECPVLVRVIPYEA